MIITTQKMVQFYSVAFICSFCLTVHMLVNKDYQTKMLQSLSKN